MTSGNAKTKVAGVTQARLAQLNTGVLEARTLTECLAVDFATLMRSALPELDEEARIQMQREAANGISRRMALAARLICERMDPTAIAALRHHPSDTVRGWACFAIGTADAMPLAERLAAIRPLADDHHFGVREWSWMAIRPYLVADLDNAIALLGGWTSAASERLRRFASESTRPRGVWCAHSGTLKQHPERALAILEPLRADPAPYVQDSVGNWLNDAAKDNPDWVRGLCARWSVESPAPTTTRICKRALRSVDRR